VVDLLIERGARHHIFSAIAMNLASEVRRIVAEDPSALNRRMSRNENHQLPLHFAVRMQRPAMVALLMELGADPLGVDASGYPAAVYATTPDIDRPVMEAIHSMTSAELVSAGRGERALQVQRMDLLASLALGDWDTAERLWSGGASGGHADRTYAGALHLMAKRGDARSVAWLLQHGADPSARWAHWDADVTPLHLAVMSDHADVVRLLLAAGADASIRDSKHDSDALGWAEFFRRTAIASMLTTRP
jgi:ankyrin repeat protein